MAKKIQTYVVAMGCIQEGAKTYLEGEEYTPPTAELEAELLERGVISGPVISKSRTAGGAKAAAPATDSVPTTSLEDPESGGGLLDGAQ